jgi:hypothetical protein
LWLYFIRSNIQEDISSGSPNTVVKGKVSRAPRTGSIMGLDSSPNVHHSSGAFQSCEQATGLNKVLVVGVTNNQKRMMSTGSSIYILCPSGLVRDHIKTHAQGEQI